MPPLHRVPGLGKQPVALTNGYTAGEVVIPAGQITCCAANLAVDQFGTSQPVPLLLAAWVIFTGVLLWGSSAARVASRSNLEGL